MNFASASDPATRVASSVPEGRPSIWIFRPCWSLQKYGTSETAWRLASPGEQRLGGVGPELGRHLPVLDAHLLGEPRVVPGESREVAHGHDAVGGEQGGVGHHAVVDLEARALQPPGRRSHADAHHHGVALEPLAGRQHDRRSRGVGSGLDGGDRGARAELDPRARVELGEPPPHLVADDRAERDLERLHDRDAEPTGRRGRGHLRADEARADHDDAPLAAERVELASQGECVVERADDVDPRCALGAGEPPWGRARRDDDGVAAEPPAVRERDRAPLDVERHRRRAGDEVDALLGQHVALHERDPRLVPHPRQQLLGERRPVVGGVGLGADEGDRTLVAVGRGAPRRSAARRAPRRR